MQFTLKRIYFSTYTNHLFQAHIVYLLLKSLLPNKMWFLKNRFMTGYNPLNYEYFVHHIIVLFKGLSESSSITYWIFKLNVGMTSNFHHATHVFVIWFIVLFFVRTNSLCTDLNVLVNSLISPLQILPWSNGTILIVHVVIGHAIHSDCCLEFFCWKSIKKFIFN